MTQRTPFDLRHWRRGAPILGALVPLALAACNDVPTGLPKWDTTWVVSGENTSIAVNTLLPAGVTVNSAGDAFVLSLAGTTFSQTLGQMCGAACTSANGQTVPKPAFTTNLSNTIALPAGVGSATVSGGQISVVLTQSMGFDPLRPSATARGYAVITATSGTVTLAKDSIPGETTAFASGSTLTRTLSPIGAVSGPITVNVKVFSPAGDPVTINTASSLSVTATPNQVRVSQASVGVTNRAVTGQQATLDLSGVDDVVKEHTNAGAILLDIANPFGVGGAMTVTITAPGTTITKPVTLSSSAASTVRVALTGSEMQSILGQNPVRVNVSGVVSAPSGNVTVQPGQTVSIGTRLELTIGPKAS
jgi:hypothetical protein